MKRILADINLVPGVSGCFLADLDGRVVARDLPHIYDDGIVSEAGHLAGFLREGLSSHGALDGVDLIFEDGRMIVSQLDSSTHLFVLCVPEVNRSLLSMTLNVAVRKLAAELENAVPRADDRRRRLEALIRLELGEHAEKALDILADTKGAPDELPGACRRITKMTRLFIDKRKSKELAGSMAEILGDAP